MKPNTGILTVFDIETTGMDPLRDQIIELSVQHGVADDSFQRTWRFKPEVPISPEAQAVHGISLKDLVNCKTFKDHAAEVRKVFDESTVLVGYNLDFDMSFLQAELRRSGAADLRLEGVHLVDPYHLWRKCEPRTLIAAHQKFVGTGFESAHSSLADVQATGRVLQGMIKYFDLNERGWDEIAELCSVRSKHWIGPTNHFQWKNDIPVFAFGKHRNRAIAEVAGEDNGSYLRWLSASDFPPHVKQIASSAPEKSAEELKNWISSTFGNPPPRKQAI